LKQTYKEDQSARDQIDRDASIQEVDVTACLVDQSEKHEADGKLDDCCGEGVGETGQYDILDAMLDVCASSSGILNHTMKPFTTMENSNSAVWTPMPLSMPLRTITRKAAREN
jgi:hypothetical protein